MVKFLKELKEKHTIAAVGGSDLIKLKEQLGESFSLFDYVFSENGLVALKNGEKFHERV